MSIIIKLTDLWHVYIWKIFTEKIEKYKIGKVFNRCIRFFCRLLWIFNIVSPPKGEAPCITYAIIRFPNKFNKIKFKKKIEYLKKSFRKKI